MSGYIGIPLFDWIFGRDNSNPTPISKQAMERDRYFVYVLYGCTVLHWSAFVFMAYTISVLDTPWFYLVAGMLSAGICNGFSIIAGHELGHKNTDSHQSWAARILLACSAFGHYTISHNIDHHKKVATPEDRSSARLGENVYRFFLRETIGTIQDSLVLEKKRLQRQGKSHWSLGNRLIQTGMITVVSYVSMLILFGPIMIPYLMIASIFAWWLLSNASYVEHYGLLRTKQADGQYERCESRHSWNSDYLFSNLMLLQVQRHSDHHQNPSRPYQVLHTIDQMPMMPQGYPSMFLLASIPPLWFAVIDPLVLKWADQNLDKINIDPAKRNKIYAKYSTISS